MSLFQKSVLNKYLKAQDKKQVKTAYQRFIDFFHDPEVIKNIIAGKEEQFQYGFLENLFDKVLDYTMNPKPKYDLTTELKNLKGAKKADGAILKDDKAIGVIELKGTKTKDLEKITEQAFGYKNHHPTCSYIVISNFEKLRLYINDAVEYEEFHLFSLTEERFSLLYLCLHRENIFADLPQKIKNESSLKEQEITKQLYKHYSEFKRNLFNNIVELNPKLDKLFLFKKTQKLLDRFLFVFFAEDKGLLPPNAITAIIDQWESLKDLDEYQPLYSRFKKFFNYLDKGHKGKKFNISAFNGGLFAPDKTLDTIKINDDIIAKYTKAFSKYDFESEVDVNILGHIFEHSLNDIEEITAELEGKEVEKNKTKRKKDGVFYTPKYITKYIVDHTVGKLCKEKKEDLKLSEVDFSNNYKTKKRRTTKDGRKTNLSVEGEKILNSLNTYRDFLLGLTICDPACGSGAFLNQALDFLIKAHDEVDEMQTKLMGGSIVFPDVEAAILENNLYGVDINDESVDIAKLSLWLRTAKKGRILTTLNNNIKCGNSLIDDKSIAGEKAFVWEKEFPKVFKDGGFDVVVGNPPYVQSHSINEDEKKFFYENYKTAEYQINLYGLFLELVFLLIKDGSLFSYIIPNYWLSTKFDSNLRKKVFLENHILILLNTFEIFESATVDTLILVGQKQELTFPKRTKLISISDTHKTIIDRLNAIALKAWSYEEEREFKTINDNLEISFNKKFSITGSHKLSDFLIFKKGMQPYEKGKGNPKQTREMMNEKIYHSDSKEDDTYLPLLKARNVKRYLLDSTSGFIKYGKNLAAARNPLIFKGERILLNRILSKKQIDGFYLTNEIINNSDIFNLIPKEGINLSLKTLYPIIVSSLCATYFKKNNINLNRKAFPKINVNTLETFPIPEMSIVSQKQLEEFADLMLEKSIKINIIIQKFERTLIRKFEIEKITKKLQNWHILTFTEFIKELKKKKVKLSLSEEAEWEDYFEAEKAKAQTIKSEIDKTDREIDQMVYDLYGLTDEEIKIVEGI